MRRLYAWLLSHFRSDLSSILSKFAKLEATLKAHADLKALEMEAHEEVIAMATSLQAAARTEYVKALQVAESVRKTFL